jgi:hyperosmotically inducible protein
MKQSRFFSSAVLALLLGLSSWASAETSLKDDQSIRAAIEQKLANDEIKNGGGPWVEVDGGVVTLTGSVKSLWAKNEAVKRAMDVGDVVAVEDKLDIAFGESDAKVAEEIAKNVRSYPFYSIFDDVNLGVQEGRVVLEGRVTMPFKSDEIEERVSKVLGVQSVENNIKTLPTSIHDQRLRASLTRRIYGDPLFRTYAFRAQPPIHIVVERGRVVLTGAVRSKVERVVAEHIARATFGVFDVENRLAIAS